LTIRHLKIFVTVCEEGSITKAGQKLFIAQPTVSFVVSELEKHYGAKLFDRISRRLHLTDAGRRLLPYAKHIVSNFDEIERVIQEGDNSGELCVGTSITIGNCLLPDLLRDFAGRRPGVTVNIRVDNSEKIEQSVLENQIDLGLIEGVPHSNQLVSEAFRDDELVLLFAPGHPWEAQDFVRPEELKHQTFLMRERGSGSREILESALLLQGIEIVPSWESVSTQAIVRAVIQGLGVAVLPLLLVETHLARGALVTRPIEDVSMQRKFFMIHHKNKYLTGAAMKFMDLCRTHGSG